jgi:twinkle protein
MANHEFIEWESLDLPTGKAKAKLKCPKCIDRRSDKRDKSLQINIKEGFGKCHYCDALTFRDDNNETSEKEYTMPVQTWRNYTNLSDTLVKWLENERGIKQFVLQELKVTEEKYYQPAIKKEVNNICFNYFEGEKVVNKKYRSGGKHFTQSTGGKPIFYNINSVIDSKQVYIVEGEFDVLAMHQIGIKNCISVPNGANDNDNYWINSEKYLTDVERFYIAVDNDSKGNELSEKIAQRLGRWRCVRVNFEGKDANDDLKAGVLEKSVKNITHYPVSGTFTANDMRDELMELYKKGLPKTLEFTGCLRALNRIFKFMLGHLVTGTGIPSHGKSEFTEWMVINLLHEQNLKASFFSPEHQPLSLHMSRFIQKVIGKPYFQFEGQERVTEKEIDQYIEWSNEKLYLTSPDAGQFATWDWLFDKFREQMFNFGINIFVVDAYNKVEHTGNKSERENITQVLSRLTQFAQQNNVLIILIAHPTKMQKENGIYTNPTLYDVSGSADFRNQTHDGYSIYRYFENENSDGYTVFTNLKTKYSFQGSIGERVEFTYHLPSGRFYPRAGGWEIKSLLEPDKPKEKAVIPQGTLTDAFGDILYNDKDEVPF